MGPILGDTLALAAGIGLSPVPIIAAILMLLSPRARTTAPAFALGWLVGIAAALTAFTALASVLPDRGETGSQPVVGVIKLLLAAALFALALRQWRGRPRADDEAELPAWMSGIDTMRPPKAFVLALALSALNPKNLVLAASAGVIIGSAAAPLSVTVPSIAVLAVLASLTIAVPVVAYLVASDRMAGPLDALRTWLSRNNPTVMATLLWVFSFVVLGKGIASF